MAVQESDLPFLHRYATPLQLLLTLALYAQLSILGGLSVAPGAWLAYRAWMATTDWSLFARILLGSCLLWGLYFSFTLCVIVVTGLFRILTRGGTPLGRFPLYSLKGIQWASFNAVILFVRFTCIDFMRGTPLIGIFHRLMGMKVGKRVQINTAVLADSNLIEIGDESVIGGDVTLVGHAVEHGNLVTGPVKIGKHVTVGLMTIIFPGVTIGDGAMIAANAVLPKGTQVGPGEIWAGIPAKKIGERKKKPDVPTPAA